MLKAKLVVVGGDAKAAEISLSLPTVIGRGREANLTLPHPLVSRQHCELFEQEGMLQVRDMKSLNGTYVDSKRIEATSILKPDQLLTIGNVTFRAIYSTKDARVADLAANTSNVIEFNEVNSSADSDSQIDGSKKEPLHERPTVRGPQKTPADDAVVADDVMQTVSTAAIENKIAGNSDVLHDFGEEAETPQNKDAPQPDHSIVAALHQAGVNDDPRDDASINDLRQQLGSEEQARVNGIDGLVVEAEDVPAQPADFSRIDLDENATDKVESNESALGSFIRKLPK